MNICKKFVAVVLASVNICILNIKAQSIVELECYDGYSFKLDNNVVSENFGKYANIGVGPYTPCGDAPSFLVGPTFELKGHGYLIFENLCWAFERDREEMMLSHWDNYFYEYMQNNCNALQEYTFACKGSLFRRMFVRKNFDGSKYVRQVSLQKKGNKVDSVVITEFPHFRRFEFGNFPKSFVKRIKLNYRNPYGVVVKIRKPEQSAVWEIRAMVFVKDKAEIDYAVNWIVDNLIVE